MSFDPTDLAVTLSKVARVLDESDLPNGNPELQAMVGDPDDHRTSPFAQFKPNPGDTQLPNPLSPVEGDEMFFAYMIPGAKNISSPSTGERGLGSCVSPGFGDTQLPNPLSPVEGDEMFFAYMIPGAKNIS